MKPKRTQLKIAHFSLIKTKSGKVQIIPDLLERGSRSARCATAIIDSNGFGGIAICSHKDKFEEQAGVLYALEYRDRAQQYYNQSNVKVIAAKSQDFPGKLIRNQILNYMENCNAENMIILND